MPRQDLKETIMDHYIINELSGMIKFSWLSLSRHIYYRETFVLWNLLKKKRKLLLYVIISLLMSVFCQLRSNWFTIVRGDVLKCIFYFEFIFWFEDFTTWWEITRYILTTS